MEMKILKTMNRLVYMLWKVQNVLAEHLGMCQQKYAIMHAGSSTIANLPNALGVFEVLTLLNLVFWMVSQLYLLFPWSWSYVFELAQKGSRWFCWKVPIEWKYNWGGRWNHIRWSWWWFRHLVTRSISNFHVKGVDK